MFLRIETSSEINVISLSSCRVVFFGDTVKIYEDSSKSCVPCHVIEVFDIVDIRLSNLEDCV